MSQKTKSKEPSASILKKHPLLSICGLLTVVLIAVIIFRHGSIPAMENQLETRTAQSQRLQSNISHSAQLQEHYDALVASNAKVTARLVRASELSMQQQYLYRLEAETGTKYKDFRPPPSGVGIKGTMTSYLTVPYSVSVEGGYPQLLTYLRRLENGPAYCRILSAGVARATNDLTNPQLVLSLNLELLGKP